MKKLVGYITTSYPNNNFTIDLALSMKEAGVDILELGVPFSDPVADGSIIEKANFEALKNNFTLKDLFEVSKKITPYIDTFWMGYMNPFYNYKMDKIFKVAQMLNIKGFIIPDLPNEESKMYGDLSKKFNQELISFIAPTHNENRIQDIVKNTKEFIYLVAYNGITGSNNKSEDLNHIINNIRKYSPTPIYIGFGVNELTCRKKVKNVDGVIVGSAFVKHLLDDSLSNTEKITNITKIAREIKDKINQ